MRQTQVLCDRCKRPISKHNDGAGYPYELEYGIAGCVKERADFCQACIDEFEKWFGLTWKELKRRNEGLEVFE